MASITSLESLHLSCVDQIGRRYNWFIDHDAIRNVLSPLCKLRSLIFTRNSYPLNTVLQGEDEGAYYSNRIPAPNDMVNFMENAMRDEQEVDNSLEIVWEAVHRQHMARHAEKYAAIFPELEWVHIGQLSFTFEHGTDGKEKAVVVDPKREERFPIMETMFGIFTE